MRRRIAMGGIGSGGMKVRDVMRQALLTTDPDAGVQEAAELMRAHQVRHLLVTDEREHLLGILTDRDLRHAAFLPMLAGHLAWEEQRLRTPRVRDLMTWGPVTIDPDGDLVQAGLVMFERRIGSLPVTAQGRLVGLITEHDVFEAFRVGAEQVVPAELYLG
jgi:acetoin utilization protein AcuB